MNSSNSGTKAVLVSALTFIASMSISSIAIANCHNGNTKSVTVSIAKSDKRSNLKFNPTSGGDLKLTGNNKCLRVILDPSIKSAKSFYEIKIRGSRMYSGVNEEPKYPWIPEEEILPFSTGDGSAGDEYFEFELAVKPGGVSIPVSTAYYTFVIGPQTLPGSGISGGGSVEN